jgi:hypothetical protein
MNQSAPSHRHGDLIEETLGRPSHEGLAKNCRADSNRTVHPECPQPDSDFLRQTLRVKRRAEEPSAVPRSTLLRRHLRALKPGNRNLSLWRRLFCTGITACAFLLQSPWAAAQEKSRSSEIEAARRGKSQKLSPDEGTKTERFLVIFKTHRYMERFTSGISGFRAKLGGLVPGGGFALGPEFYREDLDNGNVFVRVSGQISPKRYERADFNIGTSRFVKHRVFFDFYTVYHNYPSINYYGSGPQSRKSSRTDYRLEDTSIDGAFGVRPVPYWKVGVSGGYLFQNVGPGTDIRYMSSDKVFTSVQAPGIDRQPDYLRGGLFTHVDYRDNPGGPRRGGNYLVRYDYYSDQSLNLHDFRRLSVDLQQYFPFFNERRVIALRGMTTLTFTNAGQTVPFYLQPTLGGSEDLRGFRPFRFTDNNALLLSGEYRWEVFAGLTMALFADAGKVFPRRSQLNFRALEASEGIGFRFNIRENVFMRIDVGFSREGPRVWFKFNDIYRTERIRTSRFQ